MGKRTEGLLVSLNALAQAAYLVVSNMIDQKLAWVSVVLVISAVVLVILVFRAEIKNFWLSILKKIFPMKYQRKLQISNMRDFLDINLLMVKYHDAHETLEISIAVISRLVFNLGIKRILGTLWVDGLKKEFEFRDIPHELFALKTSNQICQDVEIPSKIEKCFADIKNQSGKYPKADFSFRISHPDGEIDFSNTDTFRLSREIS